LLPGTAGGPFDDPSGTKLSIAILLVGLVCWPGDYLRKEAPPEAARLLARVGRDCVHQSAAARAATLSTSIRWSTRRIPALNRWRRESSSRRSGRGGVRDSPDGGREGVRMGRWPSAKFCRALRPGGGWRIIWRASRVAGDLRRAHRSTTFERRRTVRVVLLGYDIVAVSNHRRATDSFDDRRYRTAALPFNRVVAACPKYYSKLPLLSVAWGIGQIGQPLANGGRACGAEVAAAADSTFLPR